MKLFAALLLVLAVIASLPAQEDHLPYWDFDSLFADPLPPPVAEEPTAPPAITITDMLRRRGFTFEVAYAFVGGIAPGWFEAPWYWSATGDRHYFLERIIHMGNSFTIDSQITSTFRVLSTIFFEIPGFAFRLGDFFFDYNFYDRVFVRAGKFNLSWGISPNFNFTNLLIRVPEGVAGESFIFRVDIPSGIGGFQLLALTRANLLGGIDTTTIARSDVGFGGRYNLALRQADLTMGMFHQEGMPLRAFLSVSTAFGNTDLYSEGLIAIDYNLQPAVSGAATMGFFRDFFGGILSVNGEVFYNAEGRSYWFRPRTNLLEARVTPFIEGLNGALNLFYRFPGRRGDPAIFLQARYAPFENSGQLIPGFRMNPWPNIDLHFAVPMALGSRDGFYYQNTPRMDTINNRSLPFAVVLLLSLRGSVQFRHDY